MSNTEKAMASLLTFGQITQGKAIVLLQRVQPMLLRMIALEEFRTKYSLSDHRMI